MEIHDETAYRDAIATLQRIGTPQPGTPEDKRRQDLIAAIEAYAQKSGPDARKAKPFGSIPTR